MMVATNPQAITAILAAVLDKVYPVGAIYMSMSDTSPATLFGGTWEQITDCFIRAADSNHPAGSAGGSWTHTQTVAEIASHSHTFSPLNTPIVDTGIADAQFGLHFSEGVASYRANPGNINGTGSSRPMDITNKYLAAYIWRRTA